ncbi:choline kinase family protein [Chitinophaga sp. S165]|uniref:choline kinase family protein n=1 Tax=Chitinophaga sp. S165 TaxID=2135462 RepID=UPI000D713100|nr:phosphotransferase [Chitinophaga sp. S165]PWV47672.1 thiamine kinase-like enzyme [Chitinophaga sp. S165]
MSKTLFGHIPADLTAAVETALQRTFDTDAVDIAPLAGGLSASPVFKVTADGKTYVLKLDRSANKGASLAANLKLAADAGIAPPLYYQDTENGVSISGFIDNKPVRGVFGPEKLTSELAATIRAIHAIPHTDAGNDLLTTIDALIAGFRQSNMLSGPVFDECFGNFEAVKDKYPWNDAEKVFSHNDLNPSNVLSDGEKIWIIDWDVSYVNDRYIDLANAANFFLHTEAQEKLFLDTYFGRPANDYQTARFHVMRQVGRIIYSMLMLQLAAQSKPKDYVHDQEMEGITLRDFGAMMGTGQISLATYEGQLMYGKALLNEAVHQMRSPRFTASLALI